MTLKKMKQFLNTLKAIMWALIGIRKESESEKDLKLNPLHIIIISFITLVFIVFSLILLVKYTIS